MPTKLSMTLLFCPVLLFWLVVAASVLGAETVLDIREFGSKPDGETLCTKAIQSAIDRCATNGGGRVVIPAGRFLSGMILMKNNVELHLQHNAVLLASTNRDDYPPRPVSKYPSLYNERGTTALIYAEGLSNIALTGNGRIDGQGASWKQGNVLIGAFDERPRIILFISCKNIRVEGLQLRNSAMWTQHFLTVRT